MTFDYIIVGGGTSGCLVAEYLSQKNYKVAVIEKGSNFAFLNFLTEFPLGSFFTLRSKIFTKNYICERSQNLNGRKIEWPRGECLGGSSVINGLIHKRGHKSDFDKLYNAGFSSWDWKKITKYYEEIEQRLKIFNCNTKKSNSKEIAHSIVDSFIESLKKNKFHYYDSFNESLDSTESQCAYYDLTLNNFKRSHSYNTFLNKNKNVKIFRKSLVSKIIFENLKATGVECIKNKKKNIINCNKEIILCAGTINSPKILQLSGIGEKDLLNSLGIKIKFENKNVGINLRDHLQTRLVYEVKSERNFNFLKKSNIYKIKSLYKYVFHKKGILALGPTRAGALVGNDHGEDKHNFQLNLILGSGESHKFVDKFNGISISANTLNPKSQGQIRIRSQNPYEDPEIQPNYFSHADDIEKHLKAIEIIRKVSKTNPISEQITREHLPGHNITKRQDLIDYVKNFSGTIYHPSGTCRLGDDNTGVVDGNLKVRGVQNLRICDASIFPESITGNLAASCYVAGMVLVKDILK